jgi:hypothetical protein
LPADSYHTAKQEACDTLITKQKKQQDLMKKYRWLTGSNKLDHVYNDTDAVAAMAKWKATHGSGPVFCTAGASHTRYMTANLKEHIINKLYGGEKTATVLHFGVWYFKDFGPKFFQWITTSKCTHVAIGLGQWLLGRGWEVNGKGGPLNTSDFKEGMHRVSAELKKLRPMPANLAFLSINQLPIGSFSGACPPMVSVTTSLCMK